MPNVAVKTLISPCTQSQDFWVKLNNPIEFMQPIFLFIFTGYTNNVVVDFLTFIR